ncbi:hypothetical protein HN858_05755 [Candidatus Falkowbacteria bacterium]|nr:hypothetical protein [Candidatus Falkowbacteria bacterium]
MLKKAQFKNEPASDDFRYALKSKILEKRQQKKHMLNFVKGFSSLFTVRRLSPVLAVLVIFALLVTASHYWPGQDSPFSEFSRLIISPAYAQDNFTVEATVSDSIGVESDTAFVIKSKEVVDSELLEENIQIKPELEFSFKKVNDHEFKIIPSEPLQPRVVYSVVISASIMAESGLTFEQDYSWAFQTKDQFKIIGSLPRDKSSGVPLDTGIEFTFSHDNVEEFAKHFTIEPKVDGSFEKHKRTWVFVPKNLMPGTIYRIIVDKELPLSESDEKMVKDYTLQFETSPLVNYKRGSNNKPYFMIIGDYLEFSPTREPAFKVYERNLLDSKIKLNVYSLANDTAYLEALKSRYDYPAWASYNRESSLVDTNTLSHITDYELEVREVNYNKFIVFPEVYEPGFYVIESTVQDVKRQTFFSVSELAVFSMVSTSESLVWVNSIVDKGSVQNAEVKIISSGITKSTDGQGITKFNTDTAFVFSEEDRYETDYLRVRKDGDVTIVPVSFSKQEQKEYWKYFYTDRNLFQPDDTIKFWGFVKPKDSKGIDEKVTVALRQNSYARYYNYYNEEISLAEQELEVSPDFVYSGELKLEKLVPGYYYVDVRLGDEILSTKYINIQTYDKPAYQIKVEPENKVIWSGETAVFDVNAEFFEGTPVSDLVLDYSSSNKSVKGEVEVDLAGEARIEVPSVATKCTLEKTYCSNMQTVYLNLNSTQPEVAQINQTAYVYTYNSRVYTKMEVAPKEKNSLTAKIKATVKKYDLEKRAKGSLWSVVDEEEVAPNTAIKGKIIQIIWHKNEIGEEYDYINKVVNKKYKYEKEEKVIHEMSGLTDAAGEFTYEFETEEKSYYQIRLIAIDEQGNNYLSTQMYGSSYYGNPYSSNNYEYYKLAIKGDKVKFKVDESVILEFTKNNDILSSQEKKDYLYYKMRRGLVDYSLSTEPVYEFNFKDSYIPNIYVSGVWFDGEKYHQSGSNNWYSSSSGTSIRYDYSEKELNVEVTSNKEEYAPGEDVELEVKVTNQKGNPVAATLNLSLVDEAFFQLSEDWADILASVYQLESAGLKTTYASHEALSLAPDASGMGGCFVAGTQIKMADGSYKNIEEIQIGDEILTFSDPLSKKLVRAKVLNTFEHTVYGYYLINGKLRVTPEHRVFVNNGWQMIGQSKVGDYLLDEFGQRVKIESIERFGQMVDVYNLHIEKYHTYFAEGFFVHNDKGGAREDFQDTALFKMAKTDLFGRATVRFELPDNITSWRITTQAINKDIYAGREVTALPVSLPLFINSTLPDKFLEGDSPVMQLRTYGETLTSGDVIDYEISSEALDLNKIVKQTEAFDALSVALGEVGVGQYEISSTAKKGELEDTLINKFAVAESLLTKEVQDYYKYESGVEISGSATDRTTLVFMDESIGQLYHRLLRLSWQYGDRLDQRVSKVAAQKLFKQYFSKEYKVDNFNSATYQESKGGLTLLPYSSSDFELSAKVASIAGAEFDKVSLSKYFYTKLNSEESSQEEVIISLYGLAGLGEPVLLPIQNIATLEDVTVKEKLYIALAAFEIGDRELGRKLYLEVMKENAEELDSYVRIKTGKDQDDVLQATSLAAVLAAGLNDPYHKGLWSYLADHRTKDVLINLEEVNYLTKRLPTLNVGPVSFTVNVDGKKYKKELENGQNFKLDLLPEQLARLKIEDVQGDIGVTSIYQEKVTDQAFSQYVSVDRQYYVDGQQVNHFSAGDIIEVRLYPQISVDSVDGYYQITDILPSGLKGVTRPYSIGIRSWCGLRYPYEINDQKIKFGMNKNWQPCKGLNYFKYYARVAALGEYRAEPVTIQSSNSPSIINYSKADSVQIK